MYKEIQKFRSSFNLCNFHDISTFFVHLLIFDLNNLCKLQLIDIDTCVITEILNEKNKNNKNVYELLIVFHIPAVESKVNSCFST